MRFRSKHKYHNPFRKFPPDPMGRWYLIFPLFLFFLVLACFGGALYFLNQEMKIENTWDIIAAKVIGAHQESRSIKSKGNSHTKQVAVNEVEYYDSAGTRHTLKTDGARPVGQQFSIYVDPRGINGWRIKGEQPIWLPAAILCGLVALLLSVTLYSLLSRYTTLKRVQYVLSVGYEVSAKVTVVRSRVWSSVRRRRRNLAGEFEESSTERVSYQVIAQWQNPIGEQIYFESVGIDWNPGEIVGSSVPVVVDQSAPAKNYYLGESQIERIERKSTIHL